MALNVWRIRKDPLIPLLIGGQRIGIWVTAKDSIAVATVEWIHLPARNKGRHWYFLRPCYSWAPSRWCHSLRKKACSFSDNPLWKSPHRSQTFLELCVLINLGAAKLTIKNNLHTIDYNIHFNSYAQFLEFDLFSFLT